MTTAARITTTDLTWMSITLEPRLEQGHAVVEVAEGGDHPVELAGGEALRQADDVLQGERDADGRDEGHQGGGIAQGPVGHPLHQHRHAARGGHADQQGQAEVAEGADGAGLGQDARRR